MNSYKFNLNRTYGLSIPFYFNNFIDFQINSKNQKFQIDNLNYELIDETNTNLNKHEFYLLKIYPFHNEDDAKIFFKNFEIILLTSPLEIPSSCINYPSNIQKANEYPPKDFADLTNIEYDYDLRNTVIYPIDKKGCTITGGQIKLQMNQNEEDLIKIIEKGFNYNLEQIRKNTKLKLALEVYSQLNSYSSKNKFLNLFIILEILKKEYNIPKKASEYISKIHEKVVEEKRKTNDDELKKELNKLANTLNNSKKLSITASINKYVMDYITNSKYKQEFEKYGEISKKLKNAQKVRSQIMHSGTYENQQLYDESYNFLQEFIPHFLKTILKEIN